MTQRSDVVKFWGNFLRRVTSELVRDAVADDAVSRNQSGTKFRATPFMQ
jgi:hypothetical protein